MNRKFSSLLVLLLLTANSLFSIDLKIQGDSINGYYIDIYRENTLVSTQKNGELSMFFENEDYSVRENITQWKASKYKLESNQRIELSGIVTLPRLETDVAVKVIYEVKSEKVIEKRLEFYQSFISMLYYSVSTDIVSPQKPTTFWSFDNANNKGGVIHETYPAAGYFLNDSLMVGLLTDAGNRNIWTRNIRRRPSTGKIGFRALKEICDGRPYQIASQENRVVNNNFVKLTFGEVFDFNNPENTILYSVPPVSDWKSYNGARINQYNEVYEITGDKAVSDLVGYRIPFRLPDGFYTIRFKHKSANQISIRLWKNEGTSASDVAGFHYQTNIPSDSYWVQLEETVFLSNTEDEFTNLLVASSGLKKGQSVSLQIKDLEIIQSVAQEHAYHRLYGGQKEVKKTFVFVDKSNPTLHDIRLASQVYLADGLDFSGSDEEKCLYSCYKMLMWITSRNNFAPLNVPSINYAPDMYNRDSFWSLMGVNDKDASEQIFNAWANTQNCLGANGTIVTPSMGSKEQKGNDATLEFLWFELENKRRYNSELPMDKLQKAFDYCINELDPDKDGICIARFVLGQNDVVDYPAGTTDLAVNQGMWAVTLKVAKELGFPVNEEYIEKANAAYRAFYDKKSGYLIDNKKFKHVISFNSLLPEFASIWLFNKTILTDEMVINTLNKIPYKNGYSPIMADVKNVYFTFENKPFSPNMFWENGIYYNAGSWMREEICGYVAGMKHGWKPAERRIRERLRTEITLHPDEPFSHEFLPYNLSEKDCWWPSTRVFSWNVFVLKALEVAGMR